MPTQIRVSICDDAFGMVTLLRYWLEEDGDIEVVSSAQRADVLLEQLATGRPDVVVLDRLLPDTADAAGLVSRIRETTPGTRLLLVSGMPPQALAEEAKLLAVDDHLTKATSAEALRAAVRRLAAERDADA